jgi:dihydroorotate dehydrogenase electron transfer subunit
MWHGDIRVISQSAWPGDIFEMVLDAPDIVALAKPGQFVHVRCGYDYDPLLRRPISIHRCDKEKATLTLLYKVLGRGTAQLARLRSGDSLNAMGPLGNGFTLQGDTPLLIGGGLGIAPLFGLAETFGLKAVTMVMGAQNAAGLVRQHDFAEVCRTLHVATNDGTAGYRGHAPVLGEELLSQHRFDIIYACGPKPMLRYVQQVAARFAIPCQISLEEFMACGVGACLGCTCKAAVQGNPYKKVCTDGPVFWSGEVCLDDE